MKEVIGRHTVLANNLLLAGTPPGPESEHSTVFTRSETNAFDHIASLQYIFYVSDHSVDGQHHLITSVAQ